MKIITYIFFDLAILVLGIRKIFTDVPNKAH